ncbi:MAG: tetratricopeptide repeat protein [Treponema sp.]|nr:tetratricopeptide repeat protein [Treponema sp.]
MKQNYTFLLLAGCLFLFSVCPLGSQSRKEPLSDITLYTELTSAYNSRFYPGVVQYADRICTAYPSSPLILQSLVLKGESLFALGQFSDAAMVLQKALSSLSEDSKWYIRGQYWLGRTYYAQKEYRKAIELLHGVASFAEYKMSALLYAAYAAYNLEAYDTAIPLFEYILQKKSFYSDLDYTQVLVKLTSSYAKVRQYNSLISVYNDKGSYVSDDYSAMQLKLSVAEAYAATGVYQKAYDIYCSVLESGNPQFAVIALPKAYALSVAHKKEVRQDTGTVLSLVQDTLADYPVLVAEFWIRLGIDAYNSGEYAKTLEYFASAQEQSTRTQKQLMALYEAEIDCKTAPDVQNGAQKAADRLLQVEGETVLTSEDELYSDFQLAQAEKAGVLHNWGKCRYFANQVLVIDSNNVAALYWKALSEYNTANYDACIQTLKVPAGLETPELIHLYAGAYAKSGDIKNALALYAWLAEQEILDDLGQLDYAKTLFLSGDYDNAYTEALNSDEPLARYVAGLAACNDQRWNEAVELFKEYLAAAASNEDVYKKYAVFYCGYAQYRQGNFEGSYRKMQTFIQDTYAHQLLWNAYIISAQAAIQTHHYKEAARAAESAITQASTDKRKEESIILCATVYSDQKEYDKAIALLEGAAGKRTTFGRDCCFLMAQIYARQENIAKADAQYLTVVRNFPADPLAEEALYLRAELYYTKGQYQKAVERFAEYSKEYSNGTYADASLYYQAAGYAALAQTDNAIMRYTMLLDHYPESTYRYASLKNVASLYRQEKEYSTSIKYYTQLLEEYEVQGKSDGVPLLIQQVRLLESGSDEAMVTALQNYEEQGKDKTIEGRTAGTTLVTLYFSTGNETDREKGVALAKKLLALQQKHVPAESAAAAENASHLALYYRGSGKEADSAALYLQAAEYYRMNANHTAAAQSLYSAVEAFDAAGLYADAKSAAKTLRSLYPDTMQNAAAEKIITR